MTDDEWHEYLDDAHNAVLKYGEVEFQGLVRRAIYRLQRFPASGFYGDDFTYRTLWDEWCHEVQNPNSLLGDMWDLTLFPFLKDVVDRVPQHARALLSEYARWELHLSFGEELTNLPDAESLMDLLRHRVSEAAVNRSLSHLQP